MASLSIPPSSSSPSSSSFSSISPLPWTNSDPDSDSPSTPRPVEDSRPSQASPPLSIDPREDEEPVEPESCGEVAPSVDLPSSETSPSSHESAFRADPLPLLPVSSSSSPPPKVEADSVAPSLLHLSFNQDHGCFAAGTDRGFRIYNCDPFREIFRRDFDGGGVGVVEMLFRCNILALVGGGTSPYYPPNKVMIWDDHQSRCIGELSFRSDVRAVRLRRDRIIVVLDHKIFVYNFADLKLVHQVETVPNPKGLCAVSQQQGSLVLVCPGSQKGQVRVEHYGAKATKFITAHDSRIACFALSQDGRLIATASSKGTLIRIFSTVDGVLLQEVRPRIGSNLTWISIFYRVTRFTEASPGCSPKSRKSIRIKECNFDLYRSVWAVRTGPPGYRYADQLLPGGTTKIDRWRLIEGEIDCRRSIEGEKGKKKKKKRKKRKKKKKREVPPGPCAVAALVRRKIEVTSHIARYGVPYYRSFAASQKLVKCFKFPESVPLFSGVLPKYFNSEWSVAQFRLHENSQYIVAFGHQKNTVVILGMDGRYVSSIFH
ncbi:hypothetical protein BHM03_00030642, partial [Ensete ventricosum]